MLLIQRLTSIFCFILLILKGVSADMKSCKKAVHDFLDAVNKDFVTMNTANKFVPLDFYFIPDMSLICYLTPIKNPRYSYGDFGDILKIPPPGKRFWSSANVINPVLFGTNKDSWRGLGFYVQDPTGRTALLKFVCRGKVCTKLLDKLKKVSKDHRLPCLDQEEDQRHKIYSTVQGEIEARFFGETYPIFDAFLILKSFFPNQNVTMPDSAKAMFKNDEKKIVTLTDKHGIVRGEDWFDWPLGNIELEVIQAAVYFYDIYRVQKEVNCAITDLEGEDIKERMLKILSKGPSLHEYVQQIEPH